MNNILLNIKGLNLVIGKINLLSNFNLQINKNERVGITGPSGCGKSTLMKSLLRNCFPKGSIVESFYFCNKTKSAYIPQSDGLLPWFSLKKNVSIFSNNNDTTNKILTKFNLHKSENNFPDQLSGGEYQRAVLANAIISEPLFYFADEPLTELDIFSKWELLSFWSEAMKEHYASLLLISHDIETLLYLCDRIIVLSDKPSVVLHDISVQKNHPREKEFLVSQEFITTKAQILNVIDKIK